MNNAPNIVLRGVAVHNLAHIDLDLPRGKLLVFCGVSGSGKTSLVLDTLYAEGQRRYIESFSAYTRQFLDRLERPEADRIEGLPPAVAVTHSGAARSNRSTVGTATEIVDYLRLLFARIGRVHCGGCGRELRRYSAENVAEELARLPQGTRLQIAFPRQPADGESWTDLAAALREEGFVRVIAGERTVELGESSPSLEVAANSGPWFVVVDRATAGETAATRLTESLELALAQSGGSCRVFVALSAEETTALNIAGGMSAMIDGRPWTVLAYNSNLRCEACGLDYPTLEPRLFSFNSPLGACPTCEGFGNLMDLDLELIVPDPSKSLRDGALACWSTPAHEHELTELLKVAPKLDLPVDVPFRTLTPEQVALVLEGSSAHEFAGLRAFFAGLEKRKFKMPVRVFLSRYKSARECPQCHGARLRPEALAARVGGRNIADICRLAVREAGSFFAALSLTPWERQVAKVMLEQVASRLEYLTAVGLGYLTLDRPLRTLSGGETQRVALTSTLGSNLVNMLYVLDEPSVGLHSSDVERLLTAVKGLRDRGNTVAVVEHEETFIRAADQVIEIGPAAGDRGGRVVFQGPPADMTSNPASLTGDYLAGRRGISTPEKRRPPNHGWLRLVGACGNNLQNVTVEFPLGVLCVVTGVSGAGKSSLVQDTLYGALCRRKKIECEKPLPYTDVYGDGQLDEVVLVDQSPIGLSPRSNPVTYIKAFDEIRAVFADTLDARTHNYTAGHFSFNVDGGRCTACAGEGYLQIDMQFLADVFMKCVQCQGRRYRPEILAVTYRGKNIADVLDLTVREAFTFFRGQPKVQARLKRLMDVGLDYLRLGQGANTLSSGEAQRLKLAAYLSAASRNRTLFLLDEPTTGLHFHDIVLLLDCFDALLAVGHSLIVVEHNLQVMKAADYIIDLGPGAAEEGGRIIATGTPEKVALASESATGRLLATALDQGKAS